MGVSMPTSLVRPTRRVPLQASVRLLQLAVGGKLGKLDIDRISCPVSVSQICGVPID